MLLIVYASQRRFSVRISNFETVKVAAKHDRVKFHSSFKETFS